MTEDRDALVEKVARAICESEADYPIGYFPDGSPMRAGGNWDEYMEPQHEEWRRYARAAVASIFPLVETRGGDEGYIAVVPGHCDTIAWRGAYHALPPTTSVGDGELVERDDVAKLLFEQRQTPYIWDEAVDAPTESDPGTLVSICRDDAEAVLALLRTANPSPTEQGEPT